MPTLPPIPTRQRPAPVLAGPDASSLPTPLSEASETPGWVDLLHEADYPTDVVVLDWESYFDEQYKLRKLSTVEYVTDPRFEELGVAYTWMRGSAPFAEPMAMWHTEPAALLRTLKAEYGENLEGVTVVSQNAPYDGLVMAHHHGLVPRHFIDLLGLARYYNARQKNDLGRLAKRYGLPSKGETKAFVRCTRRRRLWKNKKGPPTLLPRMTAEQELALAEYAMTDAALEWALFTRLLPTLANAHRELRLMQHTLELFMQPVLRIDAEYADRMTVAMDEQITLAAAEAGHSRAELSNKGQSFVALLRTALREVGESLPMKQGTRTKHNPTGMIPALAKDDDDCKRLRKHPSERVRKLMAAKAAMGSWPLHIARIRRMVNQAAARGGLLSVPLHYSGAHTHRWSGGERINLQNLSKRNKIELVNKIRGLIIPPDGHKLIIVDAAAIEARGVSWIAGQEDLNELFRSGAEIYCVYAGRMLGKSIRKARDTDPPPVKKFLKRARDMGKVQVLGCGYGMGPKKTVDFAASSYDVKLTAQEATKLVKTYRESVPKITRFWRDVEAAFKYTLRYNKPCEMARGLRFYKEGETMVIGLPSGNVLRYEKVRIDGTGRDERLWMRHPMKGSRLDMWGGTLTENIVQAISRDILAEGLIRCEAAGYHVALHVHDELVLCVPEAQAEEALSFTIDALSTAPAWAPDWPLAAEGKIADRYT